MRYDMRCPDCGWEGEVQCKADERRKQTCTETVAFTETCGATLEVLIAPTGITRFGFGFSPGVVTKDGKVHSQPKRRPATTKRG